MLDPAPHLLRRADLLAQGTAQQIARAVASGAVLRPRGGLYLPTGTHADVVAAAAAGGRLACVSELKRLGVFVLEAEAVHVHIEREGRVRDPATVRHWAPLLRQPHPRSMCVEPMDALIQATSCQSPRAAIATLDSALHLGVIDEEELAEVFAHVPVRRRVLRRHLDARAEAGGETFVRLIARALGCRVDVQVWIDGVGRVDLLVDGWLVVECDSRAFHGGWEAQVRDRERDLLLAERGLSVLRPWAAEIFAHPERVAAAIRGLREARRRRG